LLFEALEGGVDAGQSDVAAALRGDFLADAHSVGILAGVHDSEQHHEFKLPQILAFSHIFYNREFMRGAQASLQLNATPLTAGGVPAAPFRPPRASPA